MILKNPFKKLPENYFKQAKHLSYELVGTVQNNGTTYEVFRSEQTNFKFGDEELPTIALRVKTANGDKNNYFLISRKKDAIKFRFGKNMPEYLWRALLEKFMVLPSV